MASDNPEAELVIDAALTRWRNYQDAISMPLAEYITTRLAEAALLIPEANGIEGDALDLGRLVALRILAGRYSRENAEVLAKCFEVLTRDRAFEQAKQMKD